MSRLYPTLEDLKVDELKSAQHNFNQLVAHEPVNSSGAQSCSLYPTLDNYMGLNIRDAENQMVRSYGNNVVVGYGWRQDAQVVAPVTGNDIGIARAEIKQGLRRAVLCKDAKGMIGLRVQAVNKGVFVSFVNENSPASMAGLRFGDQILEINNQVVAGWTTDKAHKFFKAAGSNNITVVLRDRPFERTITMNKDSNGYIGFVFKDGKITHLVKDSSAARNGLLIDHQLVEVNGQNVLGLKDKDIQIIIDKTPNTVTVTIMPLFIYEHMVKTLKSSLLKKHMDHSIPEV